MNYDVDYYQILGLQKTATDVEIKKRFRELARECHPDRAGDSPEAVERFAAVREAYEILSDPELRERYDNPPVARHNPQRIHRKRWRPPSAMRSSSSSTAREANPRNRKRWKEQSNQMDLNDILGASSGGRLKKKVSHFNQQTFRRVNAVPGENIHLDVEIPANIAHNGGSVMVEYKRKIRGEKQALVAIDEIQYLRVSPNTQYGDKLVIPKLGHAGENGGVYGDLVCVVSIAAPKVREDSNKIQESRTAEERNLSISIVEAVLGGRVEIETAVGIKKISIPAGTSSGRKLRLRNVAGDGGDLLLTIQIIVPKNLDDESLELIRKFGALNPTSPR